MKYTLAHQTARQRAMEAVMQAPEGWEVWILEPKRTPPQNRLLHALLGDIEGREFGGRPRDRHEWKLLMVSAHAAATGRHTEIREGLEGELVVLRESTAQMSKSRMTSLIEYVRAWMAGGMS